ncbi:DMT family transporter [Phreatobacter stygius]|uniref:DMT family transporter n=1 Tax=Phreatobacter stygius TaxID=1940610 RepID=A0A4D7B6T3_9HYPH|nr:DMT family transporter [Phreatobacter stygius]QCI65990.1 DMT family transporter [Phreatobacter stygius]
MTDRQASQPRVLLGIAALVATGALWGSNHVVARAVRDVVPLPSMVFWRWAIGVVVLTLIALPTLRPAWPAIRARLGDLIVGGVVGVGLFSYLLIGGAYQSIAIEVGFINATTPIWVALLGLRMGEGRVPLATWLSLALAFAGTLLIITKGDPAVIAQLDFNLGNLLSLLAAITFAWFSLRLRDWTRTIGALPLSVVTAWVALLLVFLPVYLVWLLTGGPWLIWPGQDRDFALAAIAYVGLGPTMLGNLFYLYGVVTNGPQRAAVFLYLSPVFSAGFAMIWLGEQLAWFHVAGFVAIIAGLVLLNRVGRVRVPTA